jgi:hypothetical protein
MGNPKTKTRGTNPAAKMAQTPKWHKKWRLLQNLRNEASRQNGRNGRHHEVDELSAPGP